MSTSPIELVRVRLGDRLSPDRNSGRCPAHDDRRPSLSLKEANDGKVLLHCLAGCSTEAIVSAMGLTMRDLFPQNGAGPYGARGGEIVASYDYRDEQSRVLFQKVRLEPKDFRQRRPDGRGGWIWDLKGVRRVLYGLPELVAANPAETVYLCEGEKDTDRVASLGLVATTNFEGASAGRVKWRAEYNEALKGRSLAILVDNDEAGRSQSRGVAAILSAGVARSVKLVELPGLAEGGDVSNWLDAGGTKEKLLALVERQTIDEERTSVGVRLCDVKPERVEWLWRARVPFGKPTILDGDPGLGKSTLTLEIAARVSRGEPLPGDDERRDPAGVVILSAEDGLADTIRPRLEAAGADLERIIAIPVVPLMGGGEDLPEIPRDLPAVEKAVREIGARLVILDPLMAYLGADVSAHRDQDVRRALAPLARLAEETRAAVVVVRHLNKQSDGNPLYRGGGSIGIIGAARSGLLVAKDPDDEERRILAVSKSNLARTPEALAFRLEELGEVVRIHWEGTSPHTAKTLLAVPEGDEERGALDEAREFLLELLSSGAVATREVTKEARAAGVSEMTLRRAKAALGVRAVKEGYQGEWKWTLPNLSEKTTKAVKTPKDTHAKHRSVFGKDERLWTLVERFREASSWLIEHRVDLWEAMKAADGTDPAAFEAALRVGVEAWEARTADA